MAFFHTGRLKEALEEEKRALAIEPQNPRFQGNIEILEKRIKESEK